MSIKKNTSFTKRAYEKSAYEPAVLPPVRGFLGVVNPSRDPYTLGSSGVRSARITKTEKKSQSK